MSKPASITREQAAEVFSRCSYAAGIEPDRIHVRDVMCFEALPAFGNEPATEESTQMQVTVKGYTDWYEVGFDAAGLPDPATIVKLAF